MNSYRQKAGFTPSTPERPARPNSTSEPRLLVVVDTEESFDWDAPFANQDYGLSAMRRIGRVQEIFDRYNVLPTYVVDYPIASNEAAFRHLAGIVKAGRCNIGAQLHPWVNPPLLETINRRNSFPGNLPRELEAEKLRVLTAMIVENLGVRPQVYKAGRYGIGPNTADILTEFGYRVDMSIYAYREYLREGGPDFRAIPPMPYWLDRAHQLLELPVTCGYCGLFSPSGSSVYRCLDTRFGRATHLIGLAARLHLLNRVSISPEGNSLREAKRVTRSLLSQGQKIFTLAFHSPSLEPGNTPYVRSERDADRLLVWLDRYLQYFVAVIGGRPTTPLELWSLFRESETGIADADPSAAPIPSGTRLNRAASPKPTGDTAPSLRESAKLLAEISIGSVFRSRPLHDWPAWAAKRFEIKVPATVVPNPVRGPSGGANINVVLELLERTRHIAGDIAECGVFRGATLLAYGLHAEQQAFGKTVHGFDSFEGFDQDIANDLTLDAAFDPEKREGGFGNTSVSLVQRRINALGLSHRIRLVPGYFKDTLAAEDARQYAFVHLDCDIYESYRICLEYFYPKMTRGGIILIDEYDDPPWPGCNRAVDEFLARTNLPLHKIERDRYEKYFIEIR